MLNTEINAAKDNFNKFEGVNVLAKKCSRGVGGGVCTKPQEVICKL